jgi:hypothetical protein
MKGEPKPTCPGCGGNTILDRYAQSDPRKLYICNNCYHAWWEQPTPLDMMARLVKGVDDYIETMMSLMRHTKNEKEATALYELVEKSEWLNGKMQEAIWDETNDAEWEETP